MGWEPIIHVCVCACICVCVCLTWQRGGGVLYWKVLLSSPVQHAGLAPAVSHGAVPPSPPAHLHKAQTGGDVTNKPGTHSAGCLSYVNSFASFSPWQEQNTQDSSSEPTCMCAPRDKDVFPESKLCCINKIKSSARLQFEVFLRVIIVIHKCRNVSGSRRWEELSLLCHLDKIPPESKYPPPRFSLFLQDGNVHLKTSLLYCSYITLHSAPLSGRQVPIKPLIYGAWCIPWPWRAGSLAEIWDEMQRTHSKWISFQPASILQRCCKPSHFSNLRDFFPRFSSKYFGNVARLPLQHVALGNNKSDLYPRCHKAYKTPFCCWLQRAAFSLPNYTGIKNYNLPLSTYMQKIACRCI